MWSIHWKVTDVGMILLILVAIAPLVHPQYYDDTTVINCLKKSQQFKDTEDQYADKKSHDPKEPVLPSTPVKELQERAYSIELRQRPFECISNSTYEELMEGNLSYEELALNCRMQDPEPYCDPSSRYRTIDGTCNNKFHPKWGSIFTCLRRYLPPRFAGVSGFRQSVCGKPLPDPRTVSLNIHQDKTRPTKNVTHMTTLFGQMVAHDLTDTPTSFIGTKTIDCCSHPGVNQHPQCSPILISKNDPFYSKFGFTCINFVRAAMCGSCKIGKRNQMSQVTAYLDLSTVYGSIESTAKKLRMYDGTGELKSNFVNGEELLTPNFSTHTCGSLKNKEFCFNAGDHRVNQHTSLMSFHTLFHREHNRIAKHLRQINPHWDEEIIFQEARKINIAQMQNIVYGEYLPIIIGEDLMTEHDLKIGKQKRTTYDPNMDATLWALFSVAGFRLHSTIKGVVSELECQRDKRLLRFQFKNAEPLYSGNMSYLMKGISMSPAEKYDRYVSVDMTDFMQRQLTGSFGLDIAAVNIQRGRDFGLPSYTESLRILSKRSTNIFRFEDLVTYMEKENIEDLRNIYCDVNDIDVWVGMNSEKVQKNMIVGPTAAKFIAFQFSDLKKGDRFYFEHPDNFNDEQLATLRSSSLSSVMCANLKIPIVQKNAFLFSSSENEIMFCEDIQKLNLNLWKEKW